MTGSADSVAVIAMSTSGSLGPTPNGLIDVITVAVSLELSSSSPTNPVKSPDADKTSLPAFALSLTVSVSVSVSVVPAGSEMMFQIAPLYTPDDGTIESSVTPVGNVITG